MFIFDITTEDIRLIGKKSQFLDNVWDVESHDNLSGKSFRFEASFKEIGTIMKMMVSEGDSPQEDYDLVEYIFEKCPIVCRPIP
jgi:hypothetical protein